MDCCFIFGNIYVQEFWVVTEFEKVRGEWLFLNVT